MKTIITFLLLAAPILYVYTQPVSFEHTATNANTTNNRTLIDNDAINNDPSAIIAVKKLRKIVDGEVKRNPHKIQVGYDAETGRHYIQNKDNTKAMPIGSCYKVVVISSGTASGEEVTVTKDNLPFSNVIEIGTNIFVNVNDRFVVTEKFNPETPNTNEVGVFLGYNYINTDKWCLITTPSNSFSLGMHYNLIDLDETYIGMHTSAAENIDGYANTVDDFANWTQLNYDAINGKPDAGVFAQLLWVIGINIYSFVIELSSYYNVNTGFWEIHTELENYISDFSFPEGWVMSIFATNPNLSVLENIVNGINYFPNPTNGKVTIEAQTPISKVSIVNSLGQKIDVLAGDGRKNLEIDIANYLTGHYFVNVVTANRNETFRLIRN